MVNPLHVLGIPGELAATELATNSLGRLRATIKGSYKNFSRNYHPDKGGDADQMAAFTKAISEIEAASDMVLRYWIEEMADSKSLRSVDQLDRLREQLAERGTIIRHLLSTAVGVDQFAITGVTAPTSFLCELYPGSLDQLIVEIKSPSDTVASLALHPFEETDLRHIGERRYENGKWYEVLLTEHGKVIKKRPIPLTNPVSVSIIGRAELKKDSVTSMSHLNRGSLERRPETRGLSWHDPLHAWFMSRIDHRQVGGFVLVDAEGKHVTVTGDIIGP